MALKIKKKKPRGKLAKIAAARSGHVQVEPGAVFHATDQNFDGAVIQSPVPVLVDFWAEWCGPCRAVGPVVESLAKEYGERARVVKVDTDKCKMTASRYAIRSIPTLMLFKDGSLQNTLVGVKPKEELIEAIDQLL